MDRLLLELEKIKKCQFSGSEIVVSEVSRENRAIFDDFNLCA